MKQVEIYVHECVKRLPEKQRNDIQQELTVEIAEMIQQKEEEGISQAEAIQVVLEELGDPIELANRYNETKNYLIGPSYYGTYTKVLKIVLVSVLIGVSIAYGVGVLFVDLSLSEGFTNSLIIQQLINYLGITFNVTLQIVVWITVIFALIEKNEKSLFEKEIKTEAWTIKELPKNIVDNKTSKLENVISLIVYSVFLILINVNINVFRIISLSNDKIESLSLIFNVSTMSTWLLWLNVILVLLISVHLIQLASSTITKKKEFLIISLRITVLVLFVWMISSMKIFNPDLAQEIAKDNANTALWLHQSYLITVGVLILVNVISIFRKLYKLLKL